MPLRKTIVALTAAGVLALLATLVPLAQEPERLQCQEPRLQSAAESVRRMAADENLPSVAFAVAERGRVLCEAAFGWADRARRIPATPSTMYSLASISKPFTATAVMRLVEQEAVGLDQPANEYLGTARLRAFEGRAEDATIARLLTHTAGLPLHYQFFYAGGPQPAPMDDAIARYGTIVYPPGERYFYANFGYGVLERIIERVGGASYADVLRRTVLEPLGLRNTIVSDGAGLNGRAALRYGTDATPVPPYTFDHIGASGVWSSAADLVRFGIFHLGHDLPGTTPALTRDTRSLMQRNHAPADAPGRARGLGWGLTARSATGWRQVAHGGGMPGVATTLSLYPDAGVAVVVLTNTSNGAAVARMERVLATAVLPSAVPGGTDASPEPAPGGSPRVRRPPEPDSQAAAAALAGRWQGWVEIRGRQVPLEIGAKAGGVRIRLGDAQPVPFIATTSDGTWVTGRAAILLAAPDAAPAGSDAHRTILTLAVRGDRLSGWATALSSATPTFGAVSFPVRLARVAATDSR